VREGEAGRGVEEEESGGARAQEIEGAPARVARWWRWDSLQLATPPRLFPFFPPFPSLESVLGDRSRWIIIAVFHVLHQS